MFYHGSRKRIELPAREQVQLRNAEQRWIRPSELEDELTQTDRETQELFRKFVGILNRLTPQKFATLASQALQMPIDSEERLEGCVDRIFNAAVQQELFSVVYAQLCKVLSRVAVDVGTGPDVKKTTFRSLLLNRCQREFEKDKDSDMALVELRIKVIEATTLEVKEQLEEELCEKEYPIRRNRLGNIKFIGELFKAKMLSEGIMHECIRRLLQSTINEESLECFTKLIFIVGKDLDHERGQALIAQYMERVKSIINAGKVSSRIKFFLQDVLELRNANWVPRRQKDCPKKINQIHWEAKQEEAENTRGLATCSHHQRSSGDYSQSSKSGPLLMMRNKSEAKHNKSLAEFVDMDSL